MVNKKAYLKTLEAIVAIVMLLIFITAVLVWNQPKKEPTVPQDIAFLQESILNNIETNTDLRICLTLGDITCINNSISQLISASIEYDFNICNNNINPSCNLNSLPNDKTIYSDSLIIQEDDISTLFYLFLWRKVE